MLCHDVDSAAGNAVGLWALAVVVSEAAVPKMVRRTGLQLSRRRCAGRCAGHADVIYTDVLNKENVYTALSWQNGRLLSTLQC
jgi:hypothetical protein